MRVYMHVCVARRERTRERESERREGGRRGRERARRGARARAARAAAAAAAAAVRCRRCRCLVPPPISRCSPCPSLLPLLLTLLTDERALRLVVAPSRHLHLLRSARAQLGLFSLMLMKRKSVLCSPVARTGRRSSSCHRVPPLVRLLLALARARPLVTLAHLLQLQVSSHQQDAGLVVLERVVRSSRTARRPSA